MDLSATLASFMAPGISDAEDQRALEAAGLLPEVRAADFAKDMLLVNKTGPYNVLTADEFQMYCYKVVPCPKTYRHNWQTCPFAHVMERARRRDPRTCLYVDEFCEHAKKKKFCPRGDGCTFAHNLLELWLHPNRYRTIMCKDGESCQRELCFFAHLESQLRRPPPAFSRPDGQYLPTRLAHPMSQPAYLSNNDHLVPNDLLLLATQQMGLPGHMATQKTGGPTAELLQQWLAAAAPHPSDNTAKQNLPSDLLLALLKALSNESADKQVFVGGTELKQQSSRGLAMSQCQPPLVPAQLLLDSRIRQELAALSLDMASQPMLQPSMTEAAQLSAAEQVLLLEGRRLPAKHVPISRANTGFPSSSRPQSTGLAARPDFPFARKSHAIAMGYPVVPSIDKASPQIFNHGMHTM